MKKIHYGWVICAACTLLQFSVIGLLTDSFTVFQPYITGTNGFSGTQLSIMIEIRTVCSFICLFLVTAYYNKLGLRRGIVLSLIITSAAFVLYATAKSFPAYCGAFALAGLAYTLAGTVPASLLIMRWFKNREGLAVGIMASGTGIANIVGSPVFTKLIIATSTKTAFFAQAAFCVVVAVVMFFIVKTPEQKGVEPYFDAGFVAKKVEFGSHKLSKKYMLLMIAAVVMLGGYINAGFGYLTSMYTAQGFDPVLIGYGMSAIGVALIVGKCLFGFTADRFGAYTSNFVFYAASAAGLALCCFSGGTAARMFASMLCLGIGFSMVSVSIPIWAADLSDSSDYANVLKKFQMANVAGNLLFNLLPGPLADRFGSYIPVYIIFVVICILSAVLVQTVYASKRKNMKKSIRPQ